MVRKNLLVPHDLLDEIEDLIAEEKEIDFSKWARRAFRREVQRLRGVPEPFHVKTAHS